MEYIMEAFSLHKEFKGKTAVEDVSFQLREGSILGLLGPNGAGKTTTLKMITNLCARDRGEVTIAGYSLDKDPVKAMKRVGAALDSPSFYPELTARENLLYCARLYGDIPPDRVESLITYVGLKGQEKKEVRNYSLGMKQRLALARALLAEPRLVILDEPSNGLDPQGMLQLYQLIRELSQEWGVAFLISSHLLHDMENLCTDVLILNQGVHVLQGRTVDLLTEQSDIIEIVAEKKPFLEAVSSYPEIQLMRQQDSMFICRMRNHSLNTFFQWIVSNHIQVQYFSVRRKGLEDLFLERTGGGVR